MSSVQDLLASCATICASNEFKNVVLQHCSGLPSKVTMADLNTHIHPRDQMLLHSLHTHQDADVALSQYFNVSLQQFYACQQILGQFFDASDPSLQVMDFACGYGRLLRLLRLIVTPARIAAVEIQGDAVAYVTQQFGVNGLVSTADPAQFQTGQTYDFIWVASLFSHLPETLFHGWMQKLLSLLSPRGVLCFSIRGAELLPSSQLLPESGILYSSTSETGDLSGEIYGTTYVSEDFVRRSIEQAKGLAHPYFRLRKALAHEQDLYVVANDPERDLSGLKNFRRGAWGWVDVRRLSANGEVYLEGWAASLDDGPLQSIDVNINGESFACQHGIARPDVSEAFADPRLSHSGWKLIAMVDSNFSTVQVQVSARSARGERALLFVGAICK
jgi:SAM-dependent methyltransferase